MSTTVQDLRSSADRLIELHEEGDLDAVLRLADELAEAAQAHLGEDEIARESLFVARFQRAIALTEREELEAAAEAYGEAATTPIDPDDPDQRHEIAMALLHRAMCFDALGETARARDTYDEVVARFGDADDPVTRDQVVRARVNQAAGQLADGEVEAALFAADSLRATLDPSAPLGGEQWLLASRIRAAALRELGRTDEAVATLQQAVALEGDDPAVVDQREQAAADLAELADP